MASLLYNIFCPYSEDQDFTGVCGAICICSGLVAAAILSPVISRQKSSLIALKILAPIIALCHLAFIWIPQAQSLSATLVVVAILGAATFSLIPITLEYLVDILHPIAPENSSSLCWAAGQLLGIVFISIMEVLTAGDQANPPQNMKTWVKFSERYAFKAFFRVTLAMLIRFDPKWPRASSFSWPRCHTVDSLLGSLRASSGKH